MSVLVGALICCFCNPEWVWIRGRVLHILFFVQYHPRIDKVGIQAEVWILGHSELCKELLCMVIVEDCMELCCGLGLT